LTLSNMGAEDNLIRDFEKEDHIFLDAEKQDNKENKMCLDR